MLLLAELQSNGIMGDCMSSPNSSLDYSSAATLFDRHTNYYIPE